MKKKIVLISSALVLTLALQITSENSKTNNEVAEATEPTIQMNYDPDGFGGIG